METEDPRTISAKLPNDKLFWNKERRQHALIFILNLVTFLQGASVGTSSISLPRMPQSEAERISQNDTTWPIDFVVTEGDKFWISYSWLIAFIASGLVSNSVAEILGRKRSLMIDCLAFLIGYVLHAIGENATTLCVARALLGYPLVNLVFCLELTHVNMHGLAAAIFALSYALGSSAIAFLGALHPLWRINMLAMAVLALVTLVIIAIVVPESPTWSIRRNRVSDAEAAMRKIYGNDDFSKEFEKLKYVQKKMMGQAKRKRQSGETWSEPLTTIFENIIRGRKKIPRLPFSFVFLFILYLCIGWSGLTFITLNGPKLFQNQAEAMGIDKFYMNFIVSLAKIPGGIFATMFLNRFARRPLFLSSALLVIISHITMGLTSLSMLPAECAMVAIAIIQFASTAGYISVAGLLLGSLLPSSSRSIFAGIIMTFETLSALSQGAVQPYIVAAIGEGGLFFIFAGVVALCLVYMFFLMPETRGCSEVELEYIFLSPRQKGCVVRRDPKEAITRAARMLSRIPASILNRRTRTRQFRVAGSAVLATRRSTTEAPQPVSTLSESDKQCQRQGSVTTSHGLKRTPSHNADARYM